jgi:hypothetical protein
MDEILVGSLCKCSETFDPNCTYAWYNIWLKASKLLDLATLTLHPTKAIRPIQVLNPSLFEASAMSWPKLLSTSLQGFTRASFRYNSFVIG